MPLEDLEENGGGHDRAKRDADGAERVACLCNGSLLAGVYAAEECDKGYDQLAAETEAYDSKVYEWRPDR